MTMIEKTGRGVVVYLRGHEGRGIGLGHKLRAYNLQVDGRDTVEANEELGLPVDSREYGVGAQILRDLGVRAMRLMTKSMYNVLMSAVYSYCHVRFLLMWMKENEEIDEFFFILAPSRQSIANLTLFLFFLQI